MLAFLPLLGLLAGFATGLGILLGTLHVFFRDVGQLWTVVINLWFWTTPIVYHIGILPEKFHPLLKWNPLTPLFLSYQSIVLENRWPEWSSLWWPALVTVIVSTLGLVAFRRLSGEMVDEL
jgi:lipopolysaccharide transport system permease protein